MAEKPDIDNVLINEVGKATAYFEDFLSGIVDELNGEEGMSVSAELELSTSYQTIYTAPTVSESVEVTFGVTSNPTAGALTYTVNVVPSGGAVAVGNEYISAESIAAGGNDLMEGIVNMVLEPGDFISTKGSAAGLNMRLSLKEIL